MTRRKKHEAKTNESDNKDLEIELDNMDKEREPSAPSFRSLHSSIRSLNKPGIYKTVNNMGKPGDYKIVPSHDKSHGYARSEPWSSNSKQFY